MKNIIILLIFGMLWPFLARAEDISKTADISYYEEFYSLGKKESLEKGKNLATEDFKNENYKILVYGLRRFDTPSEKYLQEKYGIESYPIAGCVVSEGILGAAEGYNTQMKVLLKQKYQKDIFKESEAIKLTP